MNKIYFISLLAFISTSCLKLSDPVVTDVGESFLSGPGVFIINEGNFRSGNGSLSYYSYDSAKVFNHAFLSVNKRPLGDVPYTMAFLDNRGYIVVNNSGKIEVVDRNYLTSVATIAGIRSPRYISFANDRKAYVTSLYSDSVTILDLLNNSVSGYINLKHPSEAVVVSHLKAFFAHWVGGNKIYVINTSTDQVTDSIEVGMEPESMVTDKYGTLWVLCNGGWQREFYAELISINTTNNQIEKRFTFPSKTDSPACLQIDGAGETLYYIQNSVRRLSIYDTGLPTTDFISALNYNFYKLSINPVNNDIFVTDAADYQHKGNVLRYNKTGGLISIMQADIIPGSMCFKLGSIPVIE